MDGIPLLPHGVYSTWTWVGGKKIPSVTNLGVRPTFHHTSSYPSVVFMETHLIETALDLYGELLEVQFVSRLRGEQKFANTEALQIQIVQDIKAAKKALLST
jgi:riboflavin kinase/FMN adenylyltransferase